MGFFERLKKAIKKIKTKLITFFVIFLIICVWGVAPLVRAYVSGVHKIVEYDNRLAAIEEITQEEAERQFIEEGREKDDGMSIFLNTLLVGLKSPFSALKKCLQVEPIDYFSSYVSAIGFSFAFFGIFVFVGVMKAMPSHEYEDIENGSSDWCEGGEQYKVLHKKKGIVLAEDNYLPVDKRGNVNVLVVRRVWCW